MSYLGNIGRALVGRPGKVSRTATAISGFQVGRAASPQVDYEKIAREAYQLNVIAFRAIHETAMSVASVPFDVFIGDEEVQKHPLNLLLERPNPSQSRAQFIEWWITMQLLTGNTFIERVGPGEFSPGAEPRELYVLRSDRVKVVPGPRGMPVRYEYKVSGRKVEFDVDEDTGLSDILHIKTVNPVDDWYGQSPTTPAAPAVDQHNLGQQWNTNLLLQGARPSGAMVVNESANEGTGTLDDEQFRRFKAEIADKLQGPLNAGSVPLFEGGVKFERLSLTPQEMDWTNSLAASARNICHPYEYPPFLLGIPGDNTYSNQREARLGFWENSVIPRTRSVYADLTRWLAPLFEGGEELRMVPNFDDISALALRREQRWEAIDKVSFLKVNEKRDAAGYESVGPAGDVILVSSTSIPLDTAIDDGEPEPGARGPGPVEGEPEPEPENVPGADESMALTGSQVLNGAQVTAILDLMGQVARGELDRESAIVLLRLAFGIEEEAAEELLPEFGSARVEPEDEPAGLD